MTYIKWHMKKLLFICITLMFSLGARCQSDSLFNGTFVNEEYQIYLKLNAYEQNINVPDQEIFGSLPGYFGSKRDSRLWLVLDAEIIDKKSVQLNVVNDYGSEDFTARLVLNSDGTFTLKHIEGSTYKIVVDSKYVKIPKKIIMKKE